MRFGLIGYGLWGKMHAAAISKIEGATLAAIGCKSEATEAEARRDYPGVPVYRDYRELLLRGDIDTVDIVLPNYLHAEVGVAALDSGRDVLMEKPMATAAGECDELMAAASRNGRVLSIGEKFRLSPQWGTVKQIIDSGDIGTPMSLLITLFRFPFRFTSERWRYHSGMVGSWILEEPVHFFDQAIWYLEKWGSPISVVAHGNSKGRDPGMYDNFVSVVRFPEDIYAVITQTLAGFEHHRILELVGTEGSIRTWWSGAMDRTLHPESELKVQRRGQSEAETVQLSGQLVHAIELEDQLRQVVAAFEQRLPLVSGEEGKKAVVLCLAADRSIREGREIELDL